MTAVKQRPRARWGVIALAVTVAIVLAGPGAAASPKPSRIDISADALTIDDATRVVTATGRVRITDGTTTATAERATLHHGEGRGVLAGAARVVGPDGVLAAPEITITYTSSVITRVVARGGARLEVKASRLSATTIVMLPGADVLTAQDGVTISTAPDVVATGARLTYRRSSGTIVLEGTARVQNREGFIQGDRIDAHERGQRATVTGSVQGCFRDITVRSRTAELFGSEKKAVFLGDVEVTQPGRRMVTDKVTVWYAAGRIAAEGPTRIRLEGQP